jgi:PAS domain S-box-containing protein
MKIAPAIEDRLPTEETGKHRTFKDPILLAIGGTFVGLAGLVVGIATLWGTGPVLAEAPWYIALVSTFIALITLCVAYLAFGRYEVLRDPLSYWTGMGFATYGIGQIFFALTWPGLLPGGGALFGYLTYTPTAIWNIGATILAVFLPAAVLLHWPGEQSLPGRRWLGSVAAWLVFIVVLFGLVIAFEEYLPVLVMDDGRFTPLQQGLTVSRMIIFAGAGLLAASYYQRSGDKLAGYLAFPMLVMAFVHATAFIGGKRYDLLWYFQEVVQTGGYLIVLIGLLSEYVQLFRRERRLLEANLQQSALLDGVFDADPSGLAVVSGPDLAFVYTNPTYRYLIPDTPVDPLGRPYRQVWAANPGMAYPDKIMETLRSGKPFLHNGIVHSLPDGSERYFALQVRRMAWGAQPAALIILWDISELKRIEHAHRRSEDRYRRLIENASEGIWTIDADQKTDMINPYGASVLGYTVEEMLGKPVIELVFPEDIQHSNEVLEALKDGAAEHRAVRIRHKDGHAVWVRSSSTPIYGERGEYLGALSIFLDITERRRAEEALRESEYRFRVMADGSPLILWVTDAEGRMEFINRAYTEFFGVTLDQVQSEGWQMLVHPEDKSRYVGGFMESLQEHRLFQAEGRMRNKHGEWRWIDSQGQPRFSEDGEFMGMAGSSLDITRRKETEEALRSSEARFRIALDNIPISVASMDRDLRYTWIYQPQGGIPAMQMVGKRDDELLPAEAAAEVVALKQAVIDTGQGVEKELRLHTRKGWQNFLYHLEPLFDTAGDVGGLRSAVFDVTEMRRLENEIREQQTRVEVQHRLIEQREQERQRIARDLHDGPLQELLGAAMRLKKVAASLDNQPAGIEIREVLEGIQSQIDDLRAFATELRPHMLMTFGLSRAIRAHAESLQAKRPGLQMHLELDVEEQPLPENIRLALYRIYQESLNNILKHAQASEVWVRLKRGDTNTVLEVRDNGQGFILPGEWLDLTRKGHLGLAGMRERAEAVGGTVNIHSRPNVGTTVQVSVPVIGEKNKKEELSYQQ